MLVISVARSVATPGPCACQVQLSSETKWHFCLIVVDISVNYPVTVGQSGSRSISFVTVDPISSPSVTPLERLGARTPKLMVETAGTAPASGVSLR